MIVPNETMAFVFRKNYYLASSKTGKLWVPVATTKGKIYFLNVAKGDVKTIAQIMIDSEPIFRAIATNDVVGWDIYTSSLTKMSGMGSGVEEEEFK